MSCSASITCATTSVGRSGGTLPSSPSAPCSWLRGGCSRGRRRAVRRQPVGDPRRAECASARSEKPDTREDGLQLLAESKYLMSASEDLVIALYRLGLVQRSIARHAAAELGSQGFTALAVISRRGPVRVSEVAEQLSVDVSVASRQIAALVLAGY